MGQQQYEKDIKKDDAVATTETEIKNPETGVAEETPVAETVQPEPTENGESKEESNPNTQE